MEEEEPSPPHPAPSGCRAGETTRLLSCSTGEGRVASLAPEKQQGALLGRVGWNRSGGRVHACGCGQKPVLSTTSFTLTPCWAYSPMGSSPLRPLTTSPPHFSLSPPPPYLPFREMLKMRQPWFQTQFSGPRVRDLR